MATVDELYGALKKADAAGDTEAAKAIARAIQQASQSQQMGEAEPGLEDRGIGAAIGHGAAQGATFGFYDEGMAGIRSALGAFGDEQLGGFSERYGKALEDERMKLDSAREHHPWATGISEFVPALAYGGAGVARGIGGQLARQGLKQAGKTPLREAMKKSAGIGAGYGGLAGAGYSEADTLGGVAGDAATGVALGAGLGAGLPAAGAGIKRGYQNIARRFDSSGAGVKAAAQESARKEIMKDLQRSGLTVKEAELTLANNPHMMLADLSGQLQAQAGNVMNQPGAGGEKLRKILQSRQEKTYQRAVPQLRRGVEESHLTSQGMKVPGNYAEAEQQIITRARDMTDDLWAAAYSPNFKPTRWLKEFMGGRANKQGKFIIEDDMARAADKEAKKILKIRIRTGEIKPDDPGMTARYFDEVQRSLRDRIKMGKRGTIEMGDRVMSRYELQHAKFIREMEKTMPDEWGAARKIWAGESANSEAMTAGRRIFASDSDDVLYRLKDMTISEKDSYVVGALRAIENKLKLKVDTGDVLKQLRQTQAGKDLVELVFGGKKGYHRFMSFADDELKMLRTFAESQGSATFSRQAKGADTGGAVGTLAGMWLGMNLGIAGVPLLGRFAGRKAVNMLSRRDEIKRDAMANMLRTRNPQALQQQMQKPLLPMSPMLGTLGLGSQQPLQGLLSE